MPSEYQIQPGIASGTSSSHAIPRFLGVDVRRARQARRVTGATGVAEAE